MLSSFPIAAAVGALLGFLAGLGIGGGSLLMLWLTLVLDVPYDQSRLWNLIFFLPCAVIASLFRARQGALPVKRLLPAIVAACCAAALCSRLSAVIDTWLLKKIFGGLLLFAGIRELTCKPKDNRQPKP